jgi:DNA-directed RNA polymerase subunit RPC12/RpoP
MRLQAGRWTPWIPPPRRGQGVLHFWRLLIRAAIAGPGKNWREARTGDAMGSIQGYRCGQCRAELLATPVATNHDDRPGWTPPVLCCGQPLRLLDTGQVLSASLLPRRPARCPRCGYQVRLIVQPMKPLVCMVCQTDFVAPGEAQNESKGERESVCRPASQCERTLTRSGFRSGRRPERGRTEERNTEYVQASNASEG